MAVLKAQGKTFPTQTQVLVIGAGACGTIAALAAKEGGADVFIVERDAKPSGSTSLSSGQIPAAGTKLQRSAGLLDDTPELLYERCSFPVFQDTSQVNAWRRHGGGRDDLFVYSDVHRLVERFPHGGEPNGNPTTDEGPANLKAALERGLSA